MREDGIVRVFPRRASYTPDDAWAFIGPPPLMGRPDPADVRAVHVSCVFSWDMATARLLVGAWSALYPGRVQIGGPAFGTPANGFTPGQYVKAGVTFTSRGCPRQCGFCLVPITEGSLLLYDPVPSGWTVSDNNFLACPPDHRARVYAMLATQPKAAEFRGGIDARLVTADVADEFRDIRIASVFLAADTEPALRPLERAVQHLSWLGREKLRVYALVGWQKETVEQAEERLERIYEIGGLPFPQVYRGPNEAKRQRSSEWSALMKAWRPAAAKARMREVRDA